MSLHKLIGLSALFGLSASAAAVTGEKETYIRVVDAGNALCVIVRTPDLKYMLYDAGNYKTDDCAKAVDEIIGANEIDLVILSHSDADHVGEFPKIFSKENHRTAKKIIYTGRAGTSKNIWPKVVEALERLEKEARAQGKNPVMNLQLEPLPNTVSDKRNPLIVQLGGASVTLVAGWHSWPYGDEAGAGLSDAEKNNIVSITAKFSYAGKSVLLTGDTIGRKGGDKPDACRYAEKWMIEKSRVTLKSDLLIGQHHGGDNSSSTCFIQAVKPDYVVFGSGNDHEHPRASTAQRYLKFMTEEKIFRTDRGDDQGEKEWDYLREDRCKDQPGDDDVEIFISENPARPVRVQYKNERAPCQSLSNG